MKIERFEGVYPSIAYTDFSKIFISNSIRSDEEIKLLTKHESAHIWLQHQIRTIDIRKKEVDNFDFMRWGQATDLEIAKYIYDEFDDAIINRPLSLLKGGICKKHLANQDYKDCMYAEDFYYKLLESPMPQESHDGNSNDWLPTDNEKEDAGDNKKQQEEKEDIDLKECLEKAINLKEEFEKDFEKQKLKQEFEKITNNFKHKHSLATEIDIALGRAATKRVKSYNRPSRRESEEFIAKGTVSKQKKPEVIIYVDRSGSFCQEKTRKANDNLNIILKKYRTKINKDALFFHDELFKEEPKSSGGTNYEAVCFDIAKTQPRLAIIITDDDNCNNNCREILKDCNTKILVLAVGCLKTDFAKITNSKEFTV